MCEELCIIFIPNEVLFQIFGLGEYMCVWLMLVLFIW